MSIDYGLKRTGIAVTDTLQLIANGLDTVATHTLLDFLKTYFLTEEVEIVVIGEPHELNGSDAPILPTIRAFARQLQQNFPALKIVWQDERFTSAMAQRTIIQTVTKKKDRRDKGLTDRISAIIILQEYLERKRLGNQTFEP